jgi:electron transfer flavoprotein beta subunit
MKIAVCLKEVLDARLPVKVEPGSGQIRQTGPEQVTTLNPADRRALEAAMQLRHENPGARVEAFTVGDASGCEALYVALARGVDYVQRLESSTPFAGPPYTAALLATRLEAERSDLICCGDETLDNSSAIVGPLLAEMLDLPQVTGVVRIHSSDKKHLLVERSLDHGNRELVEMELPGLITVKPEGIDTTYISFRRLEEARRREIPVQLCEYRNGQWQSPQWPERQAQTAPRARVKKAFTPDAKVSPAERMRLIMAGGMAPQDSKSKSSVIEGDAEYVSEQLYRFLKHHEFL